MGAPAIFPIFGMVFVLLGIFNLVSMVTKASGLTEAESGYQERRLAVLQRLDAARTERN
jgi:hypothetical protein